MQMQVQPAGGSTGLAQRVRTPERVRIGCAIRLARVLAHAMQRQALMGYQFLTCPETGQLELIESDDTPVGALILDCSGLHGVCPKDCPRSCAAMIDRGDDRVREPEDDDESGPDTVDELGTPRPRAP